MIWSCATAIARAILISSSMSILVSSNLLGHHNHDRSQHQIRKARQIGVKSFALGLQSPSLLSINSLNVLRAALAE